MSIEDRRIVITPDTAEPEWQHWAKRIHGSWQKAVESIIETGKLLIEAKAELDHGEFTRMIEDRLPFGPRTAERLMAIAEHPVIGNPTQWVAFPPSWRTLSELATLPAPIVEARIKDGSINPAMQRKDAYRLKDAANGKDHSAAKHKAKMTPILKLREIDDLKEELANAETGQPFEGLGVEDAIDLICVRFGEVTAKAIADGIYKRYPKKRGRPAKAKADVH